MGQAKEIARNALSQVTLRCNSTRSSAAINSLFVRILYRYALFATLLLFLFLFSGGTADTVPVQLNKSESP